MVFNEINLSSLELGRIESEFYQPNYLFAKEKINGIPLSNFSIKVLHPAEIKRNYSAKGIRIVLAQNVRDNVFDWEPERYMPQSVRSLLSQNELEYGDILITRSGANFGQTSVITSEADGNLFGCADLLILKPGAISGLLLSTYLNTKLGKLLLVRGKYGAAQPHLAPSYIYTIPFPEYLLKIKDIVEELILTSRTLQNKSVEYYKQAQSLLEEEIGLIDKQISNNYYTTNFNSTIHFNRFDSEYYHPKYALTKKQIKNYAYGYESLLENILNIEPNVNPALFSKSMFDYIELSNIHSGLGIVEGKSQFFGANAPSRAQRKVNTGDILVSSVVGSVDKSAIIYETENEFLASSGFFHFRSEYYSSEFLLILVKSKIFTEQLKQEATGGILSAVPNEKLKNLIIPKIPNDIQNEISLLVKTSHKSYLESKQLLANAIKQVEDLIESGASKNAAKN